jgi:hypothetical protein
MIDVIVTWLGAILAVFGFSYIWFENSRPFSFGEHLYLGAVCAYTFFVIATSLKTSAIDPLLAGRLTLIIPIIIGILVFTRFTKYRWLARYAIAIMAGIGVGLIFGLTIRSQILTQIQGTITDIANATPDPISSILILIGCITSLLYFTYTKEHKGVYGKVVKVGRIFLMASFGYMLASDNLIHADGLITLLIEIIKGTLASVGIHW